MTRRPLRGAEADPFRRPAPGVADLRGRLLSGFGSPEGKVYAGAGTIWQDTDPGAAGDTWHKTTPSGNTGWALYGGGGALPAICLLTSPFYRSAWSGPLGWRWWFDSAADTVFDTGGGLYSFAEYVPGKEYLLVSTPGLYAINFQVTAQIADNMTQADYVTTKFWEPHYYGNDLPEVQSHRFGPSPADVLTIRASLTWMGYLDVDLRRGTDPLPSTDWPVEPMFDTPGLLDGTLRSDPRGTYRLTVVKYG